MGPTLQQELSYGIKIEIFKTNETEIEIRPTYGTKNAIFPPNSGKLLVFQFAYTDLLPCKPSDHHNKSVCKSAIKNKVTTQKFSTRSQSTASESFSVQKKDSKGILVDLQEQQVEMGNLQDVSFLNAVVKVHTTHSEPDYTLPWQKQKQSTSTGSAFMIKEGKLLTNAHCVKHATQVHVRRRGDDTKYVAKVLARGLECDIALLSVECEEFWQGVEPIHLGSLPNLQDSVTVVGYPLGGETISVSKGVVSRIEVTSYGHGSSYLLGIQIDAAINPGNSGGPAFNDQGECIGVAFRAIRSAGAENIGYVIPSTVVSHFLEDYERNGKYTGFPSLGVLVQKLENPALRALLKVPSNEGVFVKKVQPTSHANNVLKKGDVIVSFDNVCVGREGTVPFRSSERIPFRYLASLKFTGDEAEIGIIREGQFMKVQVALDTPEHLVPHHIDEAQPSYLVVAGLVFTPLSFPLIHGERKGRIGLKLSTKAWYSTQRFKGEQIVVLAQVLANKENIGYENRSYEQVLKLNRTWIRNIHHLAHLVDCCKDKYFVFEMEDDSLIVLERESGLAASKSILEVHGIPSDRSSDLLEPYVEEEGQTETDMLMISPFEVEN